jgi:hypothetical protein
MKTTVQLQLMAQGEILQYIPPDTYQQIILKDEHPLFRAYCIGEEGNATPRIVGGGSKVLNWLRTAISCMVQRLQYGTKIFLNHGETNAHAGRTVVGELVGKALEYVEGKMRAIAVTYIYPEHRDVPADAASIEAEIDLDPSGRSNVVDGVHVRNITGIAVGDSRYAKTAFAAAGLVAQLQAFEIQGDNTGGSVEITIDQVKAFLKNGQIAPSAVFEKPALLSDQVVGDHVIQKLTGEYAQRRQAEEDLTNLKKEMPLKITKLETENKTLRQTVAAGRASEIAKTIITERKMPEPKAKYIAIKLPDFKVEGDAVDDASIKGQLDKFVDKQLDEFTKFEAIVNPAQGGGNGKDKTEPKGEGQKADPELLARQV